MNSNKMSFWAEILLNRDAPMSLLSELRIGWGNAWWFPAVYGIITLVMIVIYARNFSKKFFRIPGVKSIKEKVPTIFGAFLFGRGLMIYSVFVPLKLNTTFFWIGVSIFIIGAIFSAIAMINFATTPQNRPVTKGIYQVMRHPIQVIAVFMWIGVGIATTSWIIIIASLLLALVSYPSFLAQERYCVNMYGDAYREYMKTTTHYFLF